MPQEVGQCALPYCSLLLLPPHQSKLARNSKSNFARGVGTVRGLLQLELGRKSVRAFAIASNSEKLYSARAVWSEGRGCEFAHAL